jgi:hypothetical protein
VLTDLRAEVRRHGLDACPADSRRLPSPIATLTIAATAPALLRLSLDIVDPATGEPSARDLDLASMPADGHSLAVAVAADELLTSSWIKLASRPLPAPAPPPSATVAAVVATTGPPPRAPARREVAALAATEHFAGGRWTPGFDLAARAWLLPRWALEGTIGARVLAEDTAAHGRVRTRALPVSLRLLASLVPSAARVRAGGAVALTATTLLFDAEPAPGTVATGQTALAIYARADLWADVGLAWLRLRAAAGAGLPLRGVTADDAGVTVAGARGLEIHGQAGLGVEW